MPKPDKRHVSRNARQAAGAGSGRKRAHARSTPPRRDTERRTVVLRTTPPRNRADAQALTRVTRETEVHGTYTRVGRVVERAPKPTLSGIDRGVVRGRYAYCVIRTNVRPRLGVVRMDEQSPRIYTVQYRDMAAVVSDVSVVPVEPTRDNVLAHDRVNELLMRDYTVIPMSFGTVFKTRQDILELLRSAYEAFNDVLNKMEDKLEFGLKVLWDRDEAARTIERENADIRRRKREISSQKGSTYFARAQYRRLIERALQQRSEAYVAEVLQRLRDVSAASRIHRPTGDRVIMNAVFLVPRDRQRRFDRRIKDIASQFDRLTFKYTGPSPPYNFVNIRLKSGKSVQHWVREFGNSNGWGPRSRVKP